MKHQEDDIYDIYQPSATAIAGLGRRSDYSYELTSESDNESTSSAVIADVFLPTDTEKKLTAEDESLLQDGHIGAGDFVSYQSVERYEPSNQPHPSFPSSKPVEKFGDILKNIKKENTPSKRKHSKITESIAAKNVTKPLITKKTSPKRQKKQEQTTIMYKPREPKLKVKAKRKDTIEFEKDDSGKYKCPQCPKVFPEIRKLKIHLRIHKKNIYKECDVCDAQYIIRHKCKKKRSYECPICLRIFNNKAACTQHKKTHTTDKNFVCNICDKAFHVKGSIIKHLATHGEKRHKCISCDKIFTSKSLLRIHYRTHTQEKPYECKYCGKRFSQQSNCNTHERIHTKAHPYMCGMCDKSFAHKSTYESHIRTHTKEKPYACEICEKQFTHRASLYNHKNSHSEPKYLCSYCDVKLAYSQALRYHENNHVKQGHRKRPPFGKVTDG